MKTSVPHEYDAGRDQLQASLKMDISKTLHSLFGNLYVAILSTKEILATNGNGNAASHQSSKKIIIIKLAI